MSVRFLSAGLLRVFSRFPCDFYVVSWPFFEWRRPQWSLDTLGKVVQTFDDLLKHMFQVLIPDAGLCKCERKCIILDVCFCATMCYRLEKC